MDIIVVCEPLTLTEEVDFLAMVNDAVAAGELTAEDASEIIDREYSLQLEV
jgi:hypothetical protein